MPPPYCYDHPRPAVTVDLAIFALGGDDLRVLLVRRGSDPFAGMWALPGGFLEIDEAVGDGALREAREETGLDAIPTPEFLGVFADPGRDPRGRTISLAHAAVLRGGPPVVRGGDDASEAAWRLARAGGKLAFDHEEMLARALEWLGQGVESGDLGLEMLPDGFDRAAVSSLLRAVGGNPRGVSRWIARMEKRGKVRPEGGVYRMTSGVTG